MNPTDPSDDEPRPRDSDANRSFGHDTDCNRRPFRAMEGPRTIRAATIRKILWLLLNLALLQASDIQLPELPGLCGQEMAQTKTAILKIGTCFYQF